MRVFREVRIVRFIAVLFLCFLCSCASMQKKMMINSVKAMRGPIKDAVNRNTDIEMVGAALPASLIQMDGFIEMAPDDKELLVGAAEAYSGYAFGFVEDKDRNRASKIYFKARGYALRALAHNEAFMASLNGRQEDFNKSLEKFDQSDVPAMFFAVNTWLKWISFNLDNPEVFMDLPKVEEMMFRIEALDENFMYGSIHAMLGAYYASRSKTLGGEPEKAKAHFEKAFKISDNKYLVFNYLYARFYAVQIQDAALFKKTLKQIIEAPENLLPERNLANEIARMKAKKLLAEADDFF